jgi:hypothetical protein
MHRHSRVAAISAFFVIVFCCFGCRPADPLDEKVPARTSLDLMMWRADIARKQTPLERRELDDMIQELKFSVMLKGTATGSDGVEAEVRAEIDGATLREVLLKGHEAKRQRLDLEKTRLEVCIDANARLQTRPGDVPSADYLDHLREQQTARLETIARELRIANERLDQLGGSARPKASHANAEPMDEQPQLLTTAGH